MKLLIKVVMANVLLLTTFICLADELQRDPFQRPDLNKQAARNPVNVDPDYLALPAAAWHPRLKGTLRSSSGSFANVDGQIIKVGESVEGFRLIAVSERAATFLKEGETVVLTLDDNFENGIYKSEDDAL